MRGRFNRPPCATAGLDTAAGFNAEEGKVLPPSPRRLRGRAPLLAARGMAAGPRRGCTPWSRASDPRATGCRRPLRGCARLGRARKLRPERTARHERQTARKWQTATGRRTGADGVGRARASGKGGWRAEGMTGGTQLSVEKMETQFTKPARVEAHIWVNKI